jgi:PAS domain S-box-containing protein
VTAARWPGRAEASALAAIVLSSQDAVIAKTLDGIVTSWNDGATAVYGRTSEQMLGQSIELTIPPNEIAAERARHHRVATGNAESGYRCIRLRADGRPIQVVMSMSPVRDDTGEVVGVATISRPVSAKETADARFASLLEAAPDAMVCVDVSGRIAMVNARVSELFGYPRDELIGASIGILIPEVLRDRHIALLEEFFRHPTPRALGAGVALQARRRDGSIFPVDISLAVENNQGDRLAIAAVRDVSVQRATEAALRVSETQLRQLAENGDLVYTLRQIEPLVNLYVSPGVSKLTGKGADELMADPALGAKIVHPDDRDRVTDFLRTAADAKQSASLEYRIVRVDGEVRWVRTFATAVPETRGLPKRIVTTTEDIAERVRVARALQKAEAEARAANNAKSEFLSRMSHELRTPLNAILGFGQLLERHLAGTDQADSAQHVVRAGRHLLDLINEVLDFARIEAGKMAVSPEPVSIAQVVDETVQLMQPLAALAGVTLVVQGGPDRTYALADLQRLRQVLLNLISNAIKYNRVDGGVWLSWTNDAGQQPSITVRDDGIGISANLHSRLFTPFDRLGAELTGIEGTGVGLTVTRGLVGLMNGELTFESAVGRGTSFTVTLPPSHEAVAAVPDRDPVLAPRGTAGLGSATLLHVEDNEANVRIMEALLELRPEWRFIHAGLVSLGLELARAHQPDLILTDVHLPDGSGLDVLVALKAEAATAQIPVVVLSADANQPQVRRMLTAGAARYLTKPVDLEEILALLDGTLSAKNTVGSGG